MTVRRLILALSTGLLVILIFPRWDLEILAWAAFVPLLFGVRGAGPAAGWRLGFAAGLAANCGILYWTTVAMAVYGDIPWVVSGILLVTLAAVLSGLYWGPWAMAVEYLGERGVPTALSAPLVWTGLEYVRNYLFTGFPWENLGYSQYLNLPVIQAAEFTGVYGISFLVMCVNASLFTVVEGILREGRSFRRSRALWAGAAAAALSIALMFGTGRLREVARTAQTLPGFTVGLVQGNIDQNVKWNPAYQEKTMAEYEALSRSIMPGRPELIIWPETAAPFYFQSDLRYRPRVLHLAQELGTYLLLGSVAYESGRGRENFYNSAFLLAPSGEESGRYDKIHMVPFGEYLPFPLHFLYPIFDKILGTIGDFTPGTNVHPLRLPRGDFGVLICYEIIFPEISRRMVLEGADFLATITNDAWFGRTSAPYQHLSMAVFRSVETRRYIVRAANTGISGIIDMTGAIVRSTDIFREAALAGEIRLNPALTFYARHGDVLPWACLAIAVGLLLVCSRRGRPSRVGREPRTIR